MKTLYFIFCLLIPSMIYSNSDYFMKTFGGTQNDYAHSIRPTADGGYIVCGQTDSYGNGKDHYPDMWIIKLDKKGDKEWDRTFGGREADLAYDIQQTNDLGYIVAGATSSFGKGYPSVWIIKLDTKGDSIWSRIYEGPIVSLGHSIIQTRDGGYILAGLGKENVLKLDRYGNREWGKHYSRLLYSIEQTTDGGFIISGDSIFRQEEWDYIPCMSLLKLDRSGNMEWGNPFGNASLGSAFSVHQTKDGGYIFTGDSIAIKSKYEHSHYALVAKLTSSGKIEWKYYGKENSAAQSIITSSGNVYISTGNCIDGEYGLNVLLFCLDKNGNEKWVRSYGNAEQWEYASSVAETADGGLVVAGQTESSGAGLYDIWIMKLDSDGNSEPTHHSNPGKNNKISLKLIYPNPVCQSATIITDLSESAETSLTICDIYGREIETIFKGKLPAGESRLGWSRKNLASGMYLICLSTRNSVISDQFILK